MSLESADSHDCDVLQEKSNVGKNCENALFVVCDVTVFLFLVPKWVDVHNNYVLLLKMT